MSWHRPYGALVGGVAQVITEFCLAPAMIVCVVIVIARASLPVELLALGVFLLLFVPVSVRSALMGIYVSSYGIRVRTMRHTETVAWADVVDIRSGSAVLGGLDLGRDAICLVLADGRAIQTPLHRGSRWRVAGSFGGTVAAGQLVVYGADYDGILLVLRERLWRENPTPIPAAATHPAAAALSPAMDPAIVARKRARGDFSSPPPGG